MTDTDDFTEAGYRALLQALAMRGYETRGYDAANPARRHLILRHDLDMSLQAAEPIAEVERDLDIAAHYFVLLRTEMYNPFSTAAQATIAHIRACGHEIGLHLDASLYDNDLKALDRAADWECRALEDVTGAEVRFISLHRPARVLLGLAKRLAGRRHAYEPRFFEEMGYCSDSRGNWHYGHPLDHEAVKAGRALQLLTHPIWWPPRPAPVQRRLNSFVSERNALLRSELGRNCESYDPRLAPTIMPGTQDLEGSNG